MCGRFVVVASLEEIVDEFGLQECAGAVRRSYNVAPGSDVPVILHDVRPRLDAFRWGLVPFWAKDPSIGARMINARAETVAEKPSFRTAFRKRRCLVVANGYYEWQKGHRKKIPYYIHYRSGQPFGFAGIYDTWGSPGREVIHSCAIITTSPNDRLKEIHDRMPAIVEKKDRALWLNPSVHEGTVLMPLLQPVDGAEMEAYPVSTLVHSPVYDLPDCMRPLEGR